MNIGMNNINDLGYIDQFQALLYNLIEDNTDKFPVSEIAKKFAKSTSLVYKAADPNSDYPFPAVWLPYLMKEKDDYRVQNFMLLLTGHLPGVKMPAFKIIKKEEHSFAIGLQKNISNSGTAFLELLNSPSTEGQKEFKKLALNTIKELLSAINYSEKAVKAQGELEL